jgi:hypothetical protein
MSFIVPANTAGLEYTVSGVMEKVKTILTDLEVCYSIHFLATTSATKNIL